MQPIIATVVAAIKNNDCTEEVILPEQRFLEQLAQAAIQLDMTFYVIQMSDFNVEKKELSGYVWSDSLWKKQRISLPDIIYDRRFHTNYKDFATSSKQLQLLQQTKNHLRLNATLPGKWAVHRILQTDSSLQQYLPPTLPFIHMKHLLALLKKQPNGVIIKPKAGMQGKGIIRIHSSDSSEKQWKLTGRTMSNQSFSINLSGIEALTKKFHTIIASQRYLLQPYLQLVDKDDYPFDLRCLLQKDKSGLWQMTSIAVRCGQQHSITSNLHGGGIAVSLATLPDRLTTFIDMKQLEQTLHSLSIHAATLLEQRLGKFAELAFDFGLDRQQQLWLLEVNSRPGRQSFTMIKDKKAQVLSTIRPLQYGHYLWKHANNDRRYSHLLHATMRSLNIQEVHR
ncbi:YheC/YheD family endospore coat-associated protein [Paenibacillus yanchengensis]|uniref:YheC/YheD family protein n=1 Tax=Paenibacillus yanchengensis TaxID=2035833 RepID=A0ABW4YLC7_9BACL